MARLRNAILLGILALTPTILAAPRAKDVQSFYIDDDASTNDLAPVLKPRKDKQKTPKYFHEPGGSMERSHYDSRYFDEEVPYAEHRYVLRDLIRSYLTIMEDKGVETWIAHGTLLGWWWNGQIMPWDYDLDVQISNDTMQWLGENMNRTEHEFKADNPNSDDNDVTKRYLLDINPHHVDKTKGDGQNIIDARWIDMGNGMFIDITGVREREDDRPGIWSCKNKHRYESQDLWPMRMSTFEGVKARIPYSFQKILSDEYGEKSLVAEEWSGHRWDHDIKEWVKMSEDEEKQRKLEAKQRKQDDLEAKRKEAEEGK